MSREPKQTRWYQFRLQSAIAATAFVAVVLMLVLRDRSFRELAENRRMYDRLDGAYSLFEVQLAMVEERLQSTKAPYQLNDCVRRDDKIDGYTGLEILESWDFGWIGAPDQDGLRQKIRECLEPIHWLARSGPRSAWEVREDVNFFQNKKQGEIIVRVRWQPYSGEPPHDPVR